MRKKPLVWLVTAATVLSVMSCSGKKGEESQMAAASVREESAGGKQAESEMSGRASEPEPSESADVPASGDWPDAFKFVRDAIRTEPSRFALKTAEGVEWSRSANPLEKALFLAHLLKDKGKTVEVARGELDDAAAKTLLGAIFPPAKAVSYKSGVSLSNPAENPALVSAVKRHFWVRMADGDDWIDLDPSYPAADPGQTFAPVGETFDPADETLSASVSIALECTEDDSNEPRSALSWEGPLAKVANRPLSLAVAAHFAAAAAEDKEEEGGGAGGLFGGLAGQSPAKQEAAGGVKASYDAVLTVGDESLAAAEIAPGEKRVTRLSLKVKVECFGEVVSESERTLYEAAGGKSEPPLFQRHALLITGNRVPAGAWQDGLKSASDKDLLADVKAGIDEIKRQLAAKKATRETFDKSAELEGRVGPGLGHLVNMIFASVSDGQAEREGAALSVAHWYAVPRLLITSFSGDEKATETSFDLRQDRVEAVALPGQAAAMRQTFLYGRGVAESTLEGKLLEVFSGKPALTTAALMRQAQRGGIAIRMFSAREKPMVDKLGPPEDVARRISAVLDAGRIVVIPEKAVTWEGRKRWGWWDVDPRTMETIGVLDTGLHQAMIQRTILETEGPLDSKMGMVVGAMTGAIDTYWLLSAMVLKHGELNKEALLEAKAYMKEIQAVMCPGFEEKVSVSVSLTVVDIEDCYKKEIEIFNAEAGVSVSMGWCDSFAKGFACVSTSILNYYLSQVEE